MVNIVAARDCGQWTHVECSTHSTLHTSEMLMHMCGTSILHYTFYEHSVVGKISVISL